MEAGGEAWWRDSFDFKSGEELPDKEQTPHPGLGNPHPCLAPSCPQAAAVAHSKPSPLRATLSYKHNPHPAQPSIRAFHLHVAAGGQVNSVTTPTPIPATHLHVSDGCQDAAFVHHNSLLVAAVSGGQNWATGVSQSAPSPALPTLPPTFMSAAGAAWHAPSPTLPNPVRASHLHVCDGCQAAALIHQHQVLERPRVKEHRLEAVLRLHKAKAAGLNVLLNLTSASAPSSS